MSDTKYRLSLQELSELATEIRQIILKGEGLSINDFVMRIDKIKPSELGYRKIKSIQHEDRLLAYFPDEVYWALKNKCNKIQKIEFQKSDDDFIRRNLNKSQKWLADHFFTEQMTIADRVRRLNIHPITTWHRYTIMEDTFILKHIDKKGPAWVSKQLGLTRASVSNRRYVLKNNLPIFEKRKPPNSFVGSMSAKTHHHYTPEDDKFILANLFKGNKYLASVFGISPSAINTRISKRLHITHKSIKQFKNLRKVAILGGAFDLITKGHSQLAEYVLKNTDIEEVWITPCFAHMYDKNMTSGLNRINMCKLANYNNTDIKVFDFEIKNKLTGGTYSFLFKLLSDPEFSHQYDFSYIIGMDNANSFEKWKKYNLLKNLVRFIVVSRQGVKNKEEMWYNKGPHIFLNAKSNIMESSSTIVRKITKEKPLNNCKYITDKVVDYIVDRGLYGCPSQGQEI